MNVFIPVVCKTSEAGHAVGMEKLVMQLQYFMDRRKIVLDSKMKANFYRKVMVFSKKKGSSLEVSLIFVTFRPKITVFSKKKGFRFRSTSDFSNFVPKLWCSLFSKKIMVITQKLVCYATHDLHALTAHH